MFCYNCGHAIQQAVSFCPFCGVSTTPLAIKTPVRVSLRLVHFLLDSIFAGLMGFAVAILWFILAIVFAPSPQLLAASSIVMNIVLLAVVFGYEPFFESIWQKTPAKWITKTKVVSNDGSKPRFWRILGRSLARLIPFEPLSYLFSPLGWHDRLSNTLVVPDHYTPEDVQQINIK